MVIGIPSVNSNSIMILLVEIMKSFDKKKIIVKKMLKKQCVSFAVDYIM